MIKRKDILKIIRENERKIKSLGVRRLGVFGSFAKSTQTVKSDIDILVEFKRGEKTFDNYMDLRFFLEKLLRRKVDLVVKDALKERIKSRIIKEVRYA
jgi:predicted nucleotidyltransferase